VKEVLQPPPGTWTFWKRKHLYDIVLWAVEFGETRFKYCRLHANKVMCFCVNHETHWKHHLYLVCPRNLAEPSGQINSRRSKCPFQLVKPSQWKAYFTSLQAALHF
jgi:hypothetical protein